MVDAAAKRRYDAVIFDLDGVLCSTDEYHYQAWKAIADELGAPFDRTVNDRLRGVSRMESLDIVLESYDGTLSASEKHALAREKNALYRKGLEGLTPSDVAEGARETLAALTGAGIKVAVGSSSKNTGLILGKLGLADVFDAVVDGNQIVYSKPDPEVFLRAAESVQVAPARCLVVEDAAAGVEAARAGGMDAASIGCAAREGLGKYRLDTLSDLLDLVFV